MPAEPRLRKLPRKMLQALKGKGLVDFLKMRAFLISGRIGMYASLNKKFLKQPERLILRGL
jgi:hypothetical protein